MPDENQPTGGTSTGIDPKLAGLLCYLLSVVGGIVFFLISKDKFIRFHALQSIFLWAAFMVLWVVFTFIPFLWWFNSIIWLAYVVTEIIMMVKAYQGEKYKLPFIGDIAERSS